MIRVPVLASSLLLALLLTGCSGMKEPIVGVTGASLGEVSNEAATVQIALQLENPNTDPIELLEFDYHVSVNGERVYDGMRSAQMTLSRLSTRTATLPAVLPFDRVGWNAAQLPPDTEVQVHGTLRYLQPGAFARTLFDLGAKRPRTSFHSTHRVSLSSPPPAPATPSGPATQSAAAFSDARDTKTQ
jgi:hypothetical protein